MLDRVQNDSRLEEDLDLRGFAELGRLLTDDESDLLADCYSRDELFRNRVVMRRHNFGEGEYKYFDYPLPAEVQMLRDRLYETLVPIANRWQQRLRTGTQFPDTLSELLDRCHTAGQTRPTPLLLRYETGGYNCLHQDLYGDHVFPLQVVVLLSSPDDFDGGEFVLTEQRPRMQSRVQVLQPGKGHGMAFAVNERPREGVRGYYRVRHRHGVSEIRRGRRLTLGIIFHDAA